MSSLLGMLIKEWFSGPQVQRRPEPAAVMDDEANVEAFHGQGEGPLIPVYHFNALAMHALLPEGGTVVDLGSGSGQYLGYLASCRPDLNIIGIDLSAPMVATGRRALGARGLAERVNLIEGDMTDFAALLPPKVDMVSTIFALHHLPSAAHLAACLAQMAAVRKATGCAVWVFDHVRPNHPATPEVFPRIFTPTAAREFQLDSQNSLIASWGFDELSQALTSAFGEAIVHRRSRLLRLYQCHWLPARDQASKARWQGAELAGATRKDYRSLAGIFPGVPQSA